MTDDPKTFSQVTGHPNMEIGSSITFSVAASKFNKNAGPSAIHIENKTWSGGAMLGVIVKNANGSMEMIGSAFMVAPGIGITAKHVFEDNSQSMNHVGGVLLFGITPNGMQLWQCKKINPGKIDDVAIILFSPFYQIPYRENVSRFALTARHPKVGNRVSIVGYKAKQFKQGLKNHEVECDIYISSGTVRAVHLHGRDKGLMPYASFQIDCESLNGMSGGPVIAEDGRVIGVISTGFVDEKEGFVTYGACIFSCLTWKISPVWPKGAYKDEIRLCNIGDTLINIDNKERIVEIEPDRFIYGYDLD